MEGKLTLDDKIAEFRDLIERRNDIKSLLFRDKRDYLVLKAGFSELFLKGKDEKLKKLIQEYYEKELEDIEYRLNNSLK